MQSNLNELARLNIWKGGMRSLKKAQRKKVVLVLTSSSESCICSKNRRPAPEKRNEFEYGRNGTGYA